MPIRREELIMKLQDQLPQVFSNTAGYMEWETSAEHLHSCMHVRTYIVHVQVYKHTVGNFHRTKFS